MFSTLQEVRKNVGVYRHTNYSLRAKTERPFSPCASWKKEHWVWNDTRSKWPNFHFWVNCPTPNCCLYVVVSDSWKMSTVPELWQIRQLKYSSTVIWREVHRRDTHYFWGGCCPTCEGWGEQIRPKTTALQYKHFNPDDSVIDPVTCNVMASVTLISIKLTDFKI